MARKNLHWIGSSKKDLKKESDDVKRQVGYALLLAQEGDKSAVACPLTGFKGAGVLEVVVDDAGDTYRAVYTVKFAKAVYALHFFKKKSKKGIKTPQPDIELIKQRLKEAENHYTTNYINNKQAMEA